MLYYLLTWTEGEEVEYRFIENVESFARSLEEKNSIVTPIDRL